MTVNLLSGCSGVEELGGGREAGERFLSLADSGQFSSTGDNGCEVARNAGLFL